MNSHLLLLLEPILPRIRRNSIPYEQREEEEVEKVEWEGAAPVFVGDDEELGLQGKREMK